MLTMWQPKYWKYFCTALAARSVSYRGVANEPSKADRSETSQLTNTCYGWQVEGSTRDGSGRKLEHLNNAINKERRERPRQRSWLGCRDKKYSKYFCTALAARRVSHRDVVNECGPVQAPCKSHQI